MSSSDGKVTRLAAGLVLLLKFTVKAVTWFMWRQHHWQDSSHFTIRLEPNLYWLLHICLTLIIIITHLCSHSHLYIQILTDAPRKREQQLRAPGLVMNRLILVSDCSHLHDLCKDTFFTRLLYLS